MTKYRIIFRCNVDKLSPILGVVGPEAELVSVTEERDELQRAGRRKFKRPHRTTNSEELLLQTMSDPNKVYSLDELQRVFEAKGFAPNSVYNPINLCASQGRVRKLGGGLFQRSTPG